MARPFNDSFTLNRLSPVRQYALRDRSENYGSIAPWGQMKLLVRDITFLVFHWDQKQYPEAVLVVVGGAPGNHYPQLSKMFPTLQIHIYDKSPPDNWAVTATDRITVYNQEFTDADAEQWAQVPNVYFTSDIRSSNIQEQEMRFLAAAGISVDGNNLPIVKEPGDKVLITKALRDGAESLERSIWADMELQQRWVRIITPRAAGLKFRLPWPDKGMDDIQTYLKCTIYVQPFATIRSTETMGVAVPNAAGEYEMAEWSLVEYDQLLAAHNYGRAHNTYQNPFNGTSKPVYAPELLTDFDSIYTTALLMAYWRYYNVPESFNLELNVIALFDSMMKSISNTVAPRAQLRPKTLSIIREGKSVSIPKATPGVLWLLAEYANVDPLKPSSVLNLSFIAANFDALSSPPINRILPARVPVKPAEPAAGGNVVRSSTTLPPLTGARPVSGATVIGGASLLNTGGLRAAAAASSTFTTGAPVRRKPAAKLPPSGAVIGKR